MKKLLYFAALLMTSCSFMPKMVDSLNDSETFAESDFQKNGVLAFVPIYEMNVDAKIEMDVSNIDSNKTYRILLTPPLKTYSTVDVLGQNVYKSEVGKSEISDTVALYALPPGKYVTKYVYAYFGDQKSVKGSITENEIVIVQNQITSLGQTLIPFEAGFFTASLPTMTTVNANIEDLLSKCKTPINKMKIRNTMINAKKK